MTTKSQLARDLGISRKTLYEYHNLACTYLEDYLNDFPRIPRTNAIPESIKDFPLSPYQCWVIEELLTLIRARVTRKHLERLFDANLYLEKFTKTSFENYRKQESQTIYEPERICQVA